MLQGIETANSSELQRRLRISEGACEGFDHLVSTLRDAMSTCVSVRVTGLFDDAAVDRAVRALDLCIVSSGGDQRVIEMCRALLSISNISDRECRINQDGTFQRRKVYFAQRKDGLIKIGSALDVKKRLSSLQTGAGEALVLLFEMGGTMKTEFAIQAEHAADRVHGEWFKPDRIVPMLAEFTLTAREAETEALEKLGFDAAEQVSH